METFILLKRLTEEGKLHWEIYPHESIGKFDFAYLTDIPEYGEFIFQVIDGGAVCGEKDNPGIIGGTQPAPFITDLDLAIRRSISKLKPKEIKEDPLLKALRNL